MYQANRFVHDKFTFIVIPHTIFPTKRDLN